MSMNREEFEAWLGKDAGEILEDLAFEWNDIPAAIAESAVARLIYKHEEAGLTWDTTLLDLGKLLGFLDEDGNWT